MIRAEIALVALLGACVAADSIAWENQGNQYNTDAYGHGVHSDQYGRAYQTQPGTEIKNNTYGFGNHSDQYGKPVHPKPMNSVPNYGWSYGN